MFESKTYQGHSYKSLKDVKAAPLMDNKGDKAHRKCGASGCHAAAVNESSGRGRCGMCHSKQSIVGDLFGGGSASVGRRSRMQVARPSSAASDDEARSSKGKRGKRKATKAGNGLFDGSKKRRRRKNSKSRKRRKKSDLFN
jgi:hypothetical protein